MDNHRSKMLKKVFFGKSKEVYLSLLNYFSFNERNNTREDDREDVVSFNHMVKRHVTD